MKKTISLVLVLAFIVGLTPGVAGARLVACVGASITYGYGLPNRAYNCYPAQLEKILRQFDSEWETRNFGVSGATLLRKGSYPYVARGAYNSALASEPDVVVIHLGGNDSTSNNWVHKDDFIPDYLALIDSFAQLPSQPDIYICYLTPRSSIYSHSRNSVIRNEIDPLISQLPTYREVHLIDLYTAMKDSPDLYQPDGVHLSIEGTRLMAEVIASVLTGVRAIPDFNGDGIVDATDMCMMVDHWHTDEQFYDIVPAPLGDGIVDIQDLITLSEYLFKEILPVELVAYWKLDETEGSIAHDIAGDNDGTLNGEPAWQATDGMINGALQFDGADDYVSTPFILDPADGAFSVFAWIKGGAAGQVVVAQKDGANWLCTDSLEGNLMTELKGLGRGAAELLSQTIITDGNWHHIGLVWDGSHRTLYVDGVAVAEYEQTNLEGSNNDLYIGAGKTLDAASFFSGLIDDVRIYDKALSAKRIEALAN